MTKDELIKWIKNDITVGGQININIPDSEYERVIKYRTRELYEYYMDSLQSKFIIISPRVFMSPEFRSNRQIQFPDCVISVYKFYELNRRNGLFGINDPDISFNRAFQSDMWFGSPMNFDTISYRLTQWMAWDQMKEFTLIDIQHSWNRNTHRLLVSGHDPHVPVYCEFYEKVPDEDLWEDPWAKKWICAYCKKEVSRMIGTFTATIIGGVTVNANIWKEEADEEIKDCKEYFKEVNTNTTFEMWP